MRLVLIKSTNKGKGRERKEVEIPATIRLRLQLWPGKEGCKGKEMGLQVYSALNGRR
jgi:hypothetical protein